MESAPELITFAERMLKSLSSHDLDSFLDGFSRHPGVLFIGSDPDEWWEGYDKIEAIGKVQWLEIAQLGDTRIDTDEIVAWKEGTVGWISVRGRMSFGQSAPREFRITFIVHEDGAFWRVVHHQFFDTVSNEESMGIELTTTVDELLLLVKDLVPSTAGTSSDGSVTIMFTDIEESTVLMESLGEQRWLELLGWHDGVVRQQTAIFGGTVVKGQGDGFMLSFPAIGSAAACAMAVQRSLAPGWAGVKLPVRIGLHVGNAKAEGGDFFGRTVVVAARVANAAAGGEILVSQAVQEGLGGSFPLDGARSLSLKGMVGNHAAFPMIWQ